MANATLAPGAITGKNIIFLASDAVFLEGDVGRIIVSGASRAIIISFGLSAGDTTSPNTHVRADILDVFVNTDPIPSGKWFLRLSPQVTLDPSKKGPEGAQVTLIAGKKAFRGGDVGKFILIYGGVVKVTSVAASNELVGEILNPLQTTDDNPPVAPAGSWTLEESSWSFANGFPRTGEFFQGRLGQASTFKQKTTFWLSESNAFDKYAVGIKAADAIDYTIAARQLNRIEWLADNNELFVGTSGAELTAKGGKLDEPLGGDVIPKVDKISTHGCAPIQPIVIGNHILFIDRSQLQVYSMVYDFNTNGFLPMELTATADHMTSTGIRLGPIAFQKRLDSRLFFVLRDGTLLTLTYFVNEKVIGFTWLKTEGLFEAVACIPQIAGKPDQIWVIVARVINGVTKRYIEVFDEKIDAGFTRPWKSLQTDCAVTYKGVPITSLAVPHLAGKTVDVVTDGGFRGTQVVIAGVVTFEEASEVEVGLHYDSICVSMEPAIQNIVIAGLPKSWNKIWISLQNTLGGVVNDERVLYAPGDLDVAGLFTGDKDVTGQGWDDAGRIKIVQDQPYPMTLLGMFGELSVGDHG